MFLKPSTVDSAVESARRGEKQGKPCHCPSVLPGEIFQATEGGGTHADLSGLPEFRKHGG